MDFFIGLFLGAALMFVQTTNNTYDKYIPIQVKNMGGDRVIDVLIDPMEFSITLFGTSDVYIHYNSTDSSGFILQIPIDQWINLRKKYR